MRALNINIILPFPMSKPVGGAKIMYEYANRLSDKGHHVTVFHSIKRPFKKSRTPLLYKRLMFSLRGIARPRWFNLNKNVESVIVPAITDKHIPDADITLSTWWQMTYAINELSASKGQKFNLIQDYENWNDPHGKLHDSYRLPVNHLVIAKYLQVIVEKISGCSPVHIPNAIDENKFFQTIEPEQRDPYSIIMLYSEEPRKGTKFGMQALYNLASEFPAIKVVMFGVYKKPEGLPEWITYYQKPDNLPELYNNASIFLSPSLGEGWALPPAEAMASGCAVVCTDIGGHLDYASHRETAMLVQPENVTEIQQNVSTLLKDKNLRLQIAKRGKEFITSQFNWHNSVGKLEDCFIAALKLKA